MAMVETERARSLYRKGFALGKLGKYEEAIKCYDKAIEIKPDH
jgi:tetratricopeptide (TPR) repeat protein